MSVTTLPLTRRTALAAASVGGAATASGCQWGPPSTVDAPAGKADADAAQVGSLKATIAAQARLVTDSVTAHASLATALEALTSLHAAHLAALTSAPVTAPAIGTAPTAEAALAAVRTGEATLQRTLTTAALEVSSGPLAQTLASMAAGVAMHLTVLPTAAPTAQSAGAWEGGAA